MKKIKIAGICLLLLTINTFSQKTNKEFQVVFKNNKVFSAKTLSLEINKCKEDIEEDTDFKDDDSIIYTFEDCAKNHVIKLMRSKGHTNSSIGKITIKRLKDLAQITIPINEGLKYSFGNLIIEGATVLPWTYFESTFPFSYGETVDTNKIHPWVEKKVLKVYKERGYDLQWVDFETRFRKVNDKKGIVDIALFVNEGNAFTIKDLVFLGNEETRYIKLALHLGLEQTNIFTEERLRYAIERLNNADIVQKINYYKDVEVTYDTSKLQVNILIKIKEKDKK